MRDGTGDLFPDPRGRSSDFLLDGEISGSFHAVCVADPVRRPQPERVNEFDNIKKPCIYQEKPLAFEIILCYTD